VAKSTVGRVQRYEFGFAVPVRPDTITSGYEVPLSVEYAIATVRAVGGSCASVMFHQMRCWLPPVQRSPPFGEETRTYGAPPQSVVKPHGFGTGPGTSELPFVSLPLTSIVNKLQARNGVVWLRVRTVSVGLFQSPVSGKVGVSVHVTVDLFIASLNVTTMSADSETLVTPAAGLVEMMYGLVQPTVKLHGFGTGPGMSGSPLVSVPAMVRVYDMQSKNSVAWDRVRMVSIGGFQERTRVIAGLIVTVTLAVSIALLNMTVMFASTGTPVAPFPGSVRVM